MSQRLPLISLVVGVVSGDLSYRLAETATFQMLLLAALVGSAILYAVSGMHELIRDAALPLVGGFALSGAVKWVFATMLS